MALDLRKYRECLSLQYCRRLVLEGKSPIYIFTGPMRAGKTAMALRFAQEIDPGFKCSEQLFFRVSDFCEFIGKNKERACVLDEAGAELGTMEFATTRSKSFSIALQTQSYKKIPLFICLPHISDLARVHRKYAHLMLHVTKPGKFTSYFPVISYHDFDDLVIFSKKVETIPDVPLPDENIWDDYINLHQDVMKKEILEVIQENLFMENKHRERQLHYAGIDKSVTEKPSVPSAPAPADY